MSDASAHHRDLDEILADALEGLATEDELTRLSDELRQNAEFRTRACRYLVDDSLIAELILFPALGVWLLNRKPRNRPQHW